MTHPLYMIMAKETKAPPEALFRPKIISVDDLMDQEVDTTDYEKLSKLFINQIGGGDDKVWDTLLKMGRRKPAIIIALLEAAVQKIGIGNTKLVNTIFCFLTEDSSSEDIVSLTESMLKARKNVDLEIFVGGNEAKDYRWRIDGLFDGSLKFSEIWAFSKDFLNTDYRKLIYCSLSAQAYPLLLKYVFTDDKTYQKVKNRIEEGIKPPNSKDEILMKTVTALDNMLK